MAEGDQAENEKKPATDLRRPPKLADVDTGEMERTIIDMIRERNQIDGLIADSISARMREAGYP